MRSQSIQHRDDYTSDNFLDSEIANNHEFKKRRPTKLNEYAKVNISKKYSFIEEQNSALMVG